MKIFAKPTKKEMMLILFLGIVLAVFYYKGLFKEIFIEGSDSSACETLIKEIGVKSFQKVGEEQCTWGRTILKYNLVDEDNDKYGVYCLSSTFSAVTMPKAIATVTCSNYNKIADKADNMNGAELLVGALGSMLSDGKTAYFLTEDEIKAREEIENEKKLIAKTAKEAGITDGNIRLCGNTFFIVSQFMGNPILILWDKENKELVNLDMEDYFAFAVDPDFDLNNCPSQAGKEAMKMIIEKHRGNSGATNNSNGTESKGNGVFQEIEVNDALGSETYYKSSCKIDGKPLYLSVSWEYPPALNYCANVSYTFFTSDGKNLSKDKWAANSQLWAVSDIPETAPKYTLDIETLTCEKAQELFPLKDCEYDNQGKIKCKQ